MSRPVSELHRGRERFQDPASDTSVDAQDAVVGGSTALGTACSPIWVARKRKRQSPASVEDPESSKSGDSKDGAIRPQKRAALGTARNPRVASKLKRQSPAGSIVHRHHTCHAPQEEVYTSSDGELPSSERDSDPSASDQGGHDNRQPKRRDSTSDFGASIWTTQEWKLLLASVDVSDSDETSVDDCRPRTHTKPSKYKTKWSASKAHT
jgi:hypothetical protein